MNLEQTNRAIKNLDSKIDEMTLDATAKEVLKNELRFLKLAVILDMKNMLVNTIDNMYDIETEKI
jgi:hypothetical protein